MSRNTVRNSLLVGCLVTLSLLHLLVPLGASHVATLEDGVLDSFVGRNIGPATMSGRIVQITGVESDPKTMYIATSSGGLLKTTDGGENWAFVFEKESSVCIGDVAVSKSDPNVVWVGTGEHNVRNSGTWGDGVYKSTDGGKTWTHMGLKDSHTVGRIAIHPTNPDIVYVGVLGHVWGANKERGVFKTTDGGKNWTNCMFIDEDTGFIDLKMDPSDPNILYGAAYRMRRDAFSGSDNPSTFYLGEKAGLYKTTDGGKNWEHLQVALPTSKYGRCGIDIYAKNPKIILAVVQTDKTPVGEANQGGANAPGGNPGAGGIYRSEDGGKTWKHINTLCPRPFYYGQIRVDPHDDSRVYVLGTSTSISNDGGKTYGGGKGGGGGGKKGGDPAKKDDPKKDDVKKDDVKKDEQKKDEQKKDEQKKDDPKKGDPKKDDPFKGGKGGKGGGGGGGGMHSDHHALWVNPKVPNEVWLGTDGGFGVSRNRGQNFSPIRSNALAQFYGISVNMTKPYYVYGGLQDNGSHGGSSATYDEIGIRLNAWGSIGPGGDGFHTQADPVDWTIVYSESQYGNFAKVKGKGGVPGSAPKKEEPAKKEEKKDDVKKDEQKKDEQKKDEQKKDDPKKGDPGKGGKGGGKGHRPLGVRFNWSCPILISPHDRKTVYYGGAYLLQSEQGTNWKRISPDLTYAPEKGKIANWRHTLFTIGESPKKKGVIWTGADDGRIMVTQNGGDSWSECKLPGIPKDGCVSRVEPSYHEDGTCYVSFTRYRNDDRKPYIFKTTDFGKNWTNITSNLKEEDGSVHVVIESSKNRNLLFCGTEMGLFVSVDGGQAWTKMKGAIPTVAVHDLVIHPRERDLVIGTHGRSVFIIDDISPLEEMTPQVAAKPSHLFAVRPALAFKPRPTTVKPKSNEFVGQNPPYGAIIQYHLKNAASDTTIAIHDAAGKEVATLKGPTTAGLHRVVWNLRADGQQATVQPGAYLAVLRAGGATQGQKIIVEAETAQK